MPPDDALFDLVGGARFVLIGEASHSTREFYAARAAMTRQLIEDRRYCTVAAEADWPDAYRVNRYVRGRGGDATASGQDRDLLAAQLVHRYLRVLRTRSLSRAADHHTWESDGMGRCRRGTWQEW